MKRFKLLHVIKHLSSTITNMSSMLLLTVLLMTSCEDQLGNVDVAAKKPEVQSLHSVTINNKVYEYATYADSETNETKILIDERSEPIIRFFEENEDYSMRVNLNTGRISYFTDYSVMSELLQQPCDLGNDNSFIENPDEGCAGSGSDGSGGNPGSGGPSGGSGGPTPGYSQCAFNTTSIKLYADAYGNGTQVTAWPIASSVPQTIDNFLSFPSPISGTVNFNDIMSSMQLCNQNPLVDTRRLEVTLFEHAVTDSRWTSGKAILFFANSGTDFRINNLKNYVRNTGFIGIGRTNWNDEVSGMGYILKGGPNHYYWY